MSPVAALITRVVPSAHLGLESLSRCAALREGDALLLRPCGPPEALGVAVALATGAPVGYLPGTHGGALAGRLLAGELLVASCSGSAASETPGSAGHPQICVRRMGSLAEDTRDEIFGAAVGLALDAFAMGLRRRVAQLRCVRPGAGASLP